jgi:L-iditol 2-dehydrogenase
MAAQVSLSPQVNKSAERICMSANRYTIDRLPENLTFAEGALLEPLSVVLHGIERARLSLGRSALICGAGPIGLIALAAARASGAHPLVITDLEPHRLEFAKDFVPSCITYQVDRSLSAEENAQTIRKLYGESDYSAPHTVLECTGVESSVCTAAFTVRRGGTIMVIGVGRPTMNNLPFMHMSLAEVSRGQLSTCIPLAILTVTLRLTFDLSIVIVTPGPRA